MVKNSLEFELKAVRPVSRVRLIRLEATVQDQKFVFSNISLCSNKNKPPEELNRMGVDDECRIIAGGGFNGNAFTPPSPLNESSYFLSVKGEMMDILTVKLRKP